MIRRYITVAGLCALVGLCGTLRVISTQRAEIGLLQRNLAALTMQAEQSAIARDVERARAKRQADRNAELSAEIETILTGGIPDAPLHPDLADIVNHRMPEGD